jgi:hypothetical protein
VYATGEIDPNRDHQIPAALGAPADDAPADLAPLADVPQLDAGIVEHPTREDYAELGNRTKATNLSPVTVGELADDAGVPQADTLKERLKRASRAQVLEMIDNVEFVEDETVPVDDDHTDGSVAEDQPAEVAA